MEKELLQELRQDVKTLLQNVSAMKVKVDAIDSFQKKIETTNSRIDKSQITILGLLLAAVLGFILGR